MGGIAVEQWTCLGIWSLLTWWERCCWWTAFVCRNRVWAVGCSCRDISQTWHKSHLRLLNVVSSWLQQTVVRISRRHWVSFFSGYYVVDAKISLASRHKSSRIGNNLTTCVVGHFLITNNKCSFNWSNLLNQCRFDGKLLHSLPINIDWYERVKPLQFFRYHLPLSYVVCWAVFHIL